ncbi:MAG: hypothetical protein JWR52_307 [Marmoricola sp.]|nr:hypothetical protein [Marmoricola sp.]
MFITLARLVAGLVAALSIGAPGAASHPPVTKHPCFEPVDVGAAARGATNPRSGDHRTITPAMQRRIDVRTAGILAGRRVSTAAVTIPVYVHVMTSKAGAGDVSNTRIARQITVLNQTYSGHDADHAGGVDTGFRFRLAGTDRHANTTWHSDGDSEAYRAQTRKGGRNALNIWLVDFGYLGIATFPWDAAGAIGIDGIRVQFSSLPGGSATHYSEGKTVTHETGHWLGLYHTFQDGCGSPGDEVADTPAQSSPSTGCPTGRDSCSAPGLDPIHNYMDYSYDACYQSFSPQQAARMKKMWTAYRA